MSSKLQQQDGEMLLKEDCEHLWKGINKNQATLNSLPSAEPIGDSQSDIPIISQLKVKCLQGEIAATKVKPLQVLPNNPVVLDCVLKEELKTRVAQLEECLAVVEGRRKELEDDLARQDELLGQQQKLQRALENRLKEYDEQGTTSRPTEDSEVKLLKKKQKKAGEIQNKLLKQIGDFVETHFPMASQDASRNTQRHDIRYSSLLEIIELLMNKGMDSDPDPYIPINEAFWPPYVELLLRCDIAARHPQDTNRIRLVPRHV